MNEEGKAVFTSPPKIKSKIRKIQSVLAQAEEDGSLTNSQLIKIVHRQTRELARIFHQLSHLHSRKEDKS